MVTLREVAKKANVSVATASYALNDSHLIKKETKEAVLKAAKQLNYRPNRSARNLKKNKSEIIGIFLSGFTGPFFGDLLVGIQDAVVEKGYELAVFASNEKHRLLQEKLVDGAIILNYHIADEQIERLANETMPVVVLDRDLTGEYINQVLLPNQHGVDLAVEHLYKKGHTRIGFIAGSEESYDGEMRLKGFKKSLMKRELDFLEMDLIRADFTEQSGQECMKDYLETHHHYPTAFVSANDEMAMGAIQAINNHGLNVPEDIAIVGFDDILLARYFNTPLTTVRVHKKQWGVHATKVLFEMLEKNDDFQIDDPTVELIVRSSS